MCGTESSLRVDIGIQSGNPPFLANHFQTNTKINDARAIFSCPGRIFSYCVRARAYTHVLARVYSTRASTCTIYTCFTLPPTRVNPTGLQLSIFQQFWSFVTNIRTSMLPNKFYGRAQPN